MSKREPFTLFVGIKITLAIKKKECTFQDTAILYSGTYPEEMIL
jgi:hypothetical protein